MASVVAPLPVGLLQRALKLSDSWDFAALLICDATLLSTSNPYGPAMDDDKR